MRPLPKLYLLLSSLLFLVFVSCRITKYKHKDCEKAVLTEQLLSPIINSHHPIKYKATIDVLKNHLTGLLIVKQTDSTTIHFVFVTELGMKMFDFGYKNNQMESVFVFQPLNKPKLIQSLMRNLEHIFLLNISYKNACISNRCIQLNEGKTRGFYLGYDTDSNDLKLKTQEIFYKKKRSSKIEYVYSPIIIDTLITDKGSRYIYTDYSHISCTQYGLVKIYIDLIAIQ